MTVPAGQLDFVPDLEIVTLLRDLVKRRSFNPPGEEAQVGTQVADWLRQAGLAVSLQGVSGVRSNVIARLRGKGTRPALLMCAHLDTVPIGETAWQHEPLGAEIEDGRLYGRGSVDTKGSLAAMMAAAASLYRSHLTLEGDLILLATVGEETGCLGARAFQHSGGMKGVGAVVVGEPTSLELVVAHRGALWLELVLHGQAAHGSMPERGVNAIQAACRLLQRISQHAFAHVAHPLLGSPTVNAGTIQGGIQPNIVPDLCRATIDIRTVPGQSHVAVLADVHGLADEIANNMPGLSVEVRTILDIPSLATPPDAPLILAASDIMMEQTGRAPVIRGAPYFTDGALLAEIEHTPALVSGPGEQTLAHSVDEHIEIAEAVKAAIFYRRLAERLLVSPTSTP